ncbi:hypothetical protein FOA52_011241 [Chlamydomonas sp. UWO 241]|nr:hypothetical protein FOA52_011241 [Chlamydomonas sp. UWO 241]
MRPVAVSAKEFLAEMVAIPGPKRYIVIGEGAILESGTGSATTALKFTSTAFKGELATISTEDKSFEAHIYLDRVGQASFAKTSVIRLAAPDASPLMSIIVNTAGWEKMASKYGELGV